MSFWEFANNLRKSGELCDVNFHLVDKEGKQQSVMAHKVIVGYYSPYLRELITGHSVRNVNISEVTEEVFLHLIQLFYQQVFIDELQNLKNFQDVAEGLKSLQVDMSQGGLNIAVLSEDNHFGSSDRIGETYDINPVTQNVYSPQLDFSAKDLNNSKDKIEPLVTRTLNFTHQNYQDVDQVITELGDSVSHSNTPEDFLTDSCNIQISPMTFNAAGLSKTNIDYLRMNHEVKSESVNDSVLQNTQSKDSEDKSATPSHSKGNGESSKMLDIPKEEIESFVQQDFAKLDEPKEQNRSSNQSSANIKTTKTICEFSIDKDETDDLLSKLEVDWEPEPVVKCENAEDENEDAACLSEIESDIRDKSGAKPQQTDTDDKAQLQRNRKKKKKKEISMNILKRFCAKQAERKQQTTPGAQDQVTELEKTGQMKEISPTNHPILKMNVEKQHKQCGSITCEECGQTFPSYSLWQRHVVIHSDEKPYECEVCGKKYSRKGNLVVHQKTHGERDRKYECKDCKSKFLSKGALKSHEKNMHEMVALSKCEHCETLFKSTYSLKTHIETKHNNKPLLSCDECEKTFTSQLYLKRHKLTHTDDLPFLCKHCGLAFRTYGARVTHLSQVHTQQLFICDVCGNNYHSKAVLLAHSKRVHQNQDTSRECPICRKFVSNFYNHIRMHKSYEKGEVFTCPECGKTFPLKTYLQQHMYVHREKRFSCNCCDKEFTFNASLQSHLKNCLHRKASVGTGLLPLEIPSLPDKQSSLAFSVSGIGFKNIQSTIQQPFVFKYQGESDKETTPPLEEMEVNQGDETTEDIDKMIADQEGNETDTILSDTDHETDMIAHSISDATTGTETLDSGDVGVRDVACSTVHGEQPERPEEPMRGMRSIRIQPGDSGKSIMIEQMSGHEFSEDQLASIVSSLGVETLKGDVQYVCILPQ